MIIGVELLLSGWTWIMLAMAILRDPEKSRLFEAVDSLAAHIDPALMRRLSSSYNAKGAIRNRSGAIDGRRL